MRSQSRGPSGDPGINWGRMFCLATQSCLTLCDPMDCDWPGSSVHGDSSSKPAGVGCHAFLQGIFPTQESNPGLLHCRRIPYPLSYQGSPNWGSTCFLSWILIQMALCCSVIHWLNLWLPVAPTASRTHLPDPWRHLMISFKSPNSCPNSCRDHLAPKCRVGQRQRQSQVSWKSSLLSHLTTSLFTFQCIPLAHITLTMPTATFEF